MNEEVSRGCHVRPRRIPLCPRSGPRVEGKLSGLGTSERVDSDQRGASELGVQARRNLGGRGPLREEDVEPRHPMGRVSNRRDLDIACADDEIGKAAFHSCPEQKCERVW